MRGESAAVAAAAAAAAAARPGKRPMRALSAAEKMEAIQRVHEGESKASVARDIGVPESTLRGWCKSEHKIRGMARNSSTPDSEAAHSPASSTSGQPATLVTSSTMNASGAHNSEDESVSPAAKRMRTGEEINYATSLSELAANGYKATSTEYLTLLNNLINSGSLTPTQGALLCQQLGLFNNTPSTKQQQQQQQQLSFIENGLQYSSKSHKRSSTSSAIAPTSHVDSVSKAGASRKSLPAAAEAPLTSLPLSPRRSNTEAIIQQQQQQQLHHYNQPSSSTGSARSSKDNSKVDPALLLWIDHQQQFMSQQKMPLGLSSSTSSSAGNNNTSTDWFWQYCKNYGGAALLAAATNIVNLNSTSLGASMNSSSNSIVEQMQAESSTDDLAKTATSSSSKKYKSSSHHHHHSSSSSSLRKSPSKARALVDEAVCINNNNESARRSLNLNDSTEDDVPMVIQQQQQQQQPTEAKEDKEEDLSLEEALQHARIFSKWLDNYRDPTVCVSQIVQFRVMLNNLEKKVSSPPVVEPSVRRTRKSTPQSISQ